MHLSIATKSLSSSCRYNIERCSPRMSYGAILAQFVASYRTRAFRVSPWHALRAPLLGCAYRWPGNGSAISRQSRCARFNLDAGEIASRLQIRHQVTYRRSRVAERAEHAPEISGLPGFGRWRRSRRERWCLAHMGYNGPVSRIGLSSEKAPCEPHIPIATVLAQFVAFYQTRAFWISPWHALRASLLGCAYRRPGNGSAI